MKEPSFTNTNKEKRFILSPVIHLDLLIMIVLYKHIDLR
jgi:hypothetical protein